MSKFSKKLISSVVPAANTTGVYSAVEQLQNLTALTITAVNPCADINGTDGGLGDDTAVNTTGGFVKLTGSGFVGGTTKVYINGVQVTYGYLSNTAIVATVPAGASGTTASLIVFNGSTVGSIWASGITYSGFPTWTTSALAGGSFVVNAQLVASGDAPLTYTFVSGTLPPNCTISSSGLLSGTITGVSVNTIYTFTVSVADAQNQNVSQSIVYTLVVSDPYYRFTSLHITGDTGSTWITDASSNTSAVTSVGSPQATTFSPVKEGYYGNSFDGVPGTNIKLVSNSAYNLSSGQYFIQAFCYPLSVHSSANGNSSHTVISQGNNANNVLWQLTINTNGTILWGFTGAGVTTSTTYPVVFDTWNHIAVSRDASNVERIFLNGKLVNQRTNTTNFNGVSDYATRIGSTYDSNFPSAYSVDAYGNVFNGYISNLQMVVGNIPAYFQTSSTTLGTTIFTTPTSPATNVTGTVLLTCQSNRFVDNSTTAAAILTSAVPKVVSSNPFNLPAGLAAYGAGYFPGTTSDYTSATLASAIGTANFTIEFWFYNTDLVNQPIFSLGPYATGIDVRISEPSASTLGAYFYGVSKYASFSTTNTWQHIAIVRSSGTSTIYLNGVVFITGFADSSNYTTTNVRIGGMQTGATTRSGFLGYISNLRIVNGTAVYTAAFTPPTAPLTAITNTSLLTLQTNVPHNNSQFRDTSTNNALVTRNGNTTQGSFSPFPKQYPYSTTLVGGSAYFDGTGDYLTLPKTSAMDFGAGDFTVECWIWKSTTVNAYGVVCMIGSGGSGYYGFTFEVSSTRGYAWYTQPSPTFVLLNYNVNPDDSQWHHFAVSRTGNTTTLYVDGIARSTSSTAYTIPSSGSNCTIGAEPSPGSFYSGYISNFRMVKGTGLYPANFTPPTAPLTPTSNTTVLLPFSNAAVYDNTMLNNFETGGNAQVNTSTFKYGTGAIRTGSGNYLLTPMKDSYQFGSGDFTVETWAYIVNNVSSAVLIDCAGGGGNFGWFLEYSSARGLFFYMGTGSSGSGATYNTTPALSTWTHLAVARQSGTVRMFINGALVNTTSLPNSSVATQPLAIGAANNYTTTYYLDGYMDEIRITKGYARYTAAFTPSSGAFSTSAPFGTSVLPSKSLRFRKSASAYLSKTFAVAGNRTTWTWSGWVKRGILGATSLTLLGAGPSSNTDFFYFGFEYSGAADKLVILDYPGASSLDLRTTQVFRDPAAWYHIVLSVDTTQAASTNRVKLYVNGAQVTSFSTATYPSQNSSTRVNSADVHNIGSDRFAASPNYTFDGEMAEVNFVDGLALDPTMFGAYSTYNQWLPISYAGYQGANGFYLPFTNTSTTSTLVADSSGNGNNWTPNNISLTAGSTYDSLTDVPTLTSATVANYAVLNPLGTAGSTPSSGNLAIASGTTVGNRISTFMVTSGKWYWEGIGDGYVGTIIGEQGSQFTGSVSTAGSKSIGYWYSDGLAYWDGGASATGTSYTTSDVIGVALDMTTGNVKFYKNNTLIHNLTFGSGTIPNLSSGVFPGYNIGLATRSVNINFGQQPFVYTPPTGFLALNTYNI